MEKLPLRQGQQAHKGKVEAKGEGSHLYYKCTELHQRTTLREKLAEMHWQMVS